MSVGRQPAPLTFPPQTDATGSTGPDAFSCWIDVIMEVTRNGSLTGSRDRAPPDCPGGGSRWEPW